MCVVCFTDLSATGHRGDAGPAAVQKQNLKPQLANICVTHDNILLDNSMAEMADSADDDDDDVAQDTDV